MPVPAAMCWLKVVLIWPWFIPICSPEFVSIGHIAAAMLAANGADLDLVRLHQTLTKLMEMRNSVSKMRGSCVLVAPAHDEAVHILTFLSSSCSGRL